MIKFNREDIKKYIPKRSGIYMFYNKDYELMYIGKAENLYNRMIYHTGYYEHLENIKHNFVYINYFLCSKNLLEQTEILLINTLKPLLNRKDIKYNCEYGNNKYYKETEWEKETHQRVDKSMENFYL